MSQNQIDKIKSGDEIISDFFKNLQSDSSLDQEIVASLLKLFNQQKLTDTAITNELLALRNKVPNEN